MTLHGKDVFSEHTAPSVLRICMFIIFCMKLQKTFKRQKLGAKDFTNFTNPYFLSNSPYRRQEKLSGFLDKSAKLRVYLD